MSQGAPVRDEAYAAPVTSSIEEWSGPIFTVRRDVLDFHGESLTRDVVVNRGGVAVVAVDEVGRVLLIRLYRHPVGALEWELPAGLLDKPGEDPLEAARRELAEEADVVAEQWEPLGEHLSSPGFSTERLHTFLARGIDAVPEAQRYAREGEERHIEVRWVALDAAIAAVVAGDIRNVTTIAGLFLARERLRRR